MSVFPVRLFGDPVLRHKASKVESVDESTVKLMNDLLDSMRAHSGVGLAAPQIGVTRRVIVWSNGEDEGALANPEILDARGSQEGEEGCLSLPGLSYPVKRAQWVRVRGLDRSGQVITIEREELGARILQHEIDHIDGILFIDHLPKDMQKEAKRLLREAVLTGSFQTGAIEF